MKIYFLCRTFLHPFVEGFRLVFQTQMMEHYMRYEVSLRIYRFGADFLL